MNIAELLRKKRYGGSFTNQEITYIVNGTVNSTLSEAQSAAFLMASCINGLNNQEISTLTLSMANSGDRFQFKSLKKKLIDKHSTGGVGDKLSLLIVPLVASCGIAVPMMSGRGLGHTGGTVDKLSSITGFCMDLPKTELVELLKNNNCFMIQQTPNIAPADRILYQLRDVTGTVESIGLITASILSKKIVEDLDGLVLDMKVGNGAFMQTMDNAKELADTMLNVAKEVGLGMTIVFTSMNQPIGYAIGNWLEVKEAEHCLGFYQDTPNDILTLTIELSTRMLMLADTSLSHTLAKQQIEDVWRNGKAHNKFHQLISSQLGNWGVATKQFANTNTININASNNGYIQHFSTRDIGITAIELKAGRKTHTDVIDYGAGIILHKKIGDKVYSDECIATIYGQTENFKEDVLHKISESITIGDEPTDVTPPILDVWES